MNTGIIKTFNETKGFGFISDDETDNEYFVHVSGLIDEVTAGDAVEFKVVEGRKGLIAVDVRIIK